MPGIRLYVPAFIALLIAIPVVTCLIVGAARRSAEVKNAAAEPLFFNTFDLPGISSPPVVSASQCGLGDDEIVIGIAAYGEARAYWETALGFAGNPATHVVNDVLGSIPVTITHCDLAKCTRVFTRNKHQGPLDVRAGGITHANQVALIVDGKRYSQGSKNIPLAEVPFVKMTWKEWREKHPDSTVYVGEQL